MKKKSYQIRMAADGKYYALKLSRKGGQVLNTTETYTRKESAYKEILSDVLVVWQALFSLSAEKPTMSCIKAITEDKTDRDKKAITKWKNICKQSEKRISDTEQDNSYSAIGDIHKQDNVTCPSSATPPIIEPGCSHEIGCASLFGKAAAIYVNDVRDETGLFTKYSIE